MSSAAEAKALTMTSGRGRQEAAIRVRRWWVRFPFTSLIPNLRICQLMESERIRERERPFVPSMHARL
uniref:Uncharacterized protein n=1 Tax=Oryza sativa subsp. japonica TaxID=39947 RepID=Q5Z6Y2_ORYSJ|nr:hypothetical protein [Oryza sativa Japonica Group]BAD54287.1 hypothetical protein [Oryza sativa Japonica Group]